MRVNGLCNCATQRDMYIHTKAHALMHKNSCQHQKPGEKINIKVFLTCTSNIHISFFGLKGSGEGAIIIGLEGRLSET